MTAMLIQIAITSMWGLLFVMHIRRLFRLTQIGIAAGPWDQHLRQCAHRLWWVLGRQEFWRKVQSDTCRCLEITLMLLVLAWVI